MLFSFFDVSNAGSLAANKLREAACGQGKHTLITGGVVARLEAILKIQETPGYINQVRENTFCFAGKGASN